MAAVAQNRHARLLMPMPMLMPMNKREVCLAAAAKHLTTLDAQMRSDLTYRPMRRLRLPPCSCVGATNGPCLLKHVHMMVRSLWSQRFA